MSAESYLCKTSQTKILRINLILVIIIDKIKCERQVAVQQIFKFTAFFRTEVEDFESTVTNWELKRYVERI